MDKAQDVRGNEAGSHPGGTFCLWGMCGNL